MSAPDHSALLTKLIIAGEAAIQMRHGFNGEALAELVEQIRGEANKPADQERVIGEAVLMCTSAVLCADTYLRSYSRAKARPFVQVIGVLLPEVRTALDLAIEQRKRPMP